MRDSGKCFWKTVCDEMGAQDNTTFQSEHYTKKTLLHFYNKHTSKPTQTLSK